MGDNAWDQRVLALRARAASRLARHPRTARAAARLGEDTRTGLDRLVPPDRVWATGFVLSLLVATDSAATWVWLRSGIAVEGNPFVDGLIRVSGAGVALTVRALWSVALVTLLTWLATRRQEARFGLVVVAVPLTVVAGLHVLGLILWLTT